MVSEVIRPPSLDSTFQAPSHDIASSTEKSQKLNERARELREKLIKNQRTLGTVLPVTVVKHSAISAETTAQATLSHDIGSTSEKRLSSTPAQSSSVTSMGVKPVAMGSAMVKVTVENPASSCAVAAKNLTHRNQHSNYSAGAPAGVAAGQAHTPLALRSVVQSRALVSPFSPNTTTTNEAEVAKLISDITRNDLIGHDLEVGEIDEDLPPQKSASHTYTSNIFAPTCVASNPAVVPVSKPISKPELEKTPAMPVSRPASTTSATTQGPQSASAGLGIKTHETRPKGPRHARNGQATEPTTEGQISISSTVSAPKRQVPKPSTAVIISAPPPKSVPRLSKSTSSQPLRLPQSDKPKSLRNSKASNSHNESSAGLNGHHRESVSTVVVRSGAKSSITLGELLEVDPLLKLWLEATGYFDIEYRNRTLEPYRKLAELEDQRAKLVKEIEQSSGRPFTSTPAMFSPSAFPTDDKPVTLVASQRNGAHSLALLQKRACDDYSEASNPIPHKVQRIEPVNENAGRNWNRDGPRSDSPSRRRFSSPSRRRLSSSGRGGPRPGRSSPIRYVPRPLSERIDSRPNSPYDRPLLPGPRESPHYGGPKLDLGRKGESIFFIMKSFTEETVRVCMKDGLWMTQAQNGPKLVDAYKRFRNVILFFSVNKSKRFQGYARMVSPPHPDNPRPKWTTALHWVTSDPMRVKWISTTDTDFFVVHHLANPYNDNMPVLVGKDGQEIEDGCARDLIRIMDDIADDNARAWYPDRARSQEGRIYGNGPYRGPDIYSRSRSVSRSRSRRRSGDYRGDWWPNDNE